jgi:hypothetical protein
MKKRIIHIHIIIDKVASQSVRRGSTIISVLIAILVTFSNDYLLYVVPTMHKRLDTNNK